MTTAPADPITDAEYADLRRQVTYDEGTHSWRYTGPLDAGQRLVESYSTVAEVRHDSGAYSVLLNLDTDEPPTRETANSWGTSRNGDPEEAWRFAIGVELGDPDEE